MLCRSACFDDPLRRAIRGVVPVVLAVLGGCASNFPSSPEAYRQFAKGNILMSTEEISVDRPLSAVTASFSAASQHCFNRIVSSSGQYRRTAYGGASFSVTTQYTSKVTTSPNGAELAVRAKTLHTTGYGHLLSGEPADGYYHAVIDATPQGGATKITYHVAAINSSEWLAAIRSWVDGKPDVCPEE